LAKQDTIPTDKRYVTIKGAGKCWAEDKNHWHCSKNGR